MRSKNSGHPAGGRGGRLISLARRIAAPSAAMALAVCVVCGAAGDTIAAKSSKKPVNIPAPRYGAISQPVWSPSGEAVAFVYSMDGDTEIYVARADGTDPQNASKNKEVDTNPVWSPDGRSLLYTSKRSGQTDIYKVNVNNGRPGSSTRITKSPKDDAWPAWSPDGRTIAFCNYETVGAGTSGEDIGTTHVYFTDSEGGKAEIFYNGQACYPAFSADGKRLAVSAQGDILVFNLKNRKSENVTEKLIEGNMVEDTYPVWAPRGSRIAFVGAFEAYSAEIYTISSGGKKVRRITDDLFENFYPRWHPKGKGVVYAAYADERRPEIFVSQPETPEKTRLTENNVVEMSPCFSPDGKSIIYVRRGKAQDELYIMNADGSDQRPFLKKNLPTVKDVKLKKDKEREKGKR